MKVKRILRIALIVVAALVGAAILLGALNALFGGGEWTFGWTAYRYDDTGFEVGSGTVYVEDLKGVDIDWIDGRVEVIVCDDFLPSVTEASALDLTEDSRMRRYVDAEEKTLTVKYRKPSSFLGGDQNKQKDLIVRIPKRMLEGLKTLRINAASSEVRVEGVWADSLEIVSKSGNVSVALHPQMESISIQSKQGDVVLLSAEAPSLSLFYETKRGGSPTLDFFFEQRDGRLVSGEGRTVVNVATERGGLTVKSAK